MNKRTFNSLPLVITSSSDANRFRPISIRYIAVLFWQTTKITITIITIFL